MALPAEAYSHFTTPGPDEWTIHFNSALGLSGTARFNPETESFEPAYLPENDALTAAVTPRILPEEDKVDQLTIGFGRTEEGAWRPARVEPVAAGAGRRFS